MKELYTAVRCYDFSFEKLPEKFRVVGFDHEPIATLTYKHLEIQLDTSMIHQLLNIMNIDSHTTFFSPAQQFIHGVRRIEEEMYKDIHNEKKCC